MKLDTLTKEPAALESRGKHLNYSVNEEASISAEVALRLSTVV
jgi:plasmid maintenance system antidote protein VapI